MKSIKKKLNLLIILHKISISKNSRTKTIKIPKIYQFNKFQKEESHTQGYHQHYKLIKNKRKYKFNQDVAYQHKLLNTKNSSSN